MPGTKGLGNLSNSHQLCAADVAHGAVRTKEDGRKDSQLLAHPGILAACSISTDVPKASRLTQVSALCDLAGGHSQSKQQATRTPPNEGGEQPCGQEDLRSSVRIGCIGWGGSRASTRRDYERISIGIMDGVSGKRPASEPAKWQAGRGTRNGEQTTRTGTTWKIWTPPLLQQ